QALIKGIAQVGLDPLYMGLGPIYAINKLLVKTGFKLEDIDILELNEAFSAQAIAVLKQLALDHQLSYEDLLSKTNLGGGAIALGHPVGASGARIVVTLINHLKRCRKKYGIASLCIGGGMGIAILIENTEV
ncbi:MAG: acetyl-CoA C-acyltransferase, partial [Bacilli bacterium]